MLNLPHHLLAEADGLALAGERDEAHLAALAGLEADRRAGGNVEPEAARLGAVEFQRRIGLEEMIVRADLDRPVAGIGDFERDRLAARRSSRCRPAPPALSPGMSCVVGAADRIDGR